MHLTPVEVRELSIVRRQKEHLFSLIEANNTMNELFLFFFVG